MWKISSFFITILIYASCVNANPCENINLGFVNDDSCCECYFSCVNGIAHPVRCPNGEHFREDPPACVNANLGVCNVCASGDGSPSRHPVPRSCTKYTLCVNGNGIDRECASGTRFDPVTLQCQRRELVDCPYASCPETGVEIIEDPNSCYHFIICENGVEVDRIECAPGLIFHPEVGQCVREEEFTCPFRVARPGDRFMTFEDIPTVPTRIPTAPTRIPNTDEYDDTRRIVYEWPRGPITCPRTGFFHFGHHSSCSVFQVCFHGQLSIVNCPPGQFWTTIDGRCEFPSRSNCPH